MNKRALEFVSSASVSEIAHGIEAWLRNDRGMEVQVFHLEGDMYALQARCRRGDAARLFGLDRAIGLRLVPLDDGGVRALIGGSRWRDKVLAASVSLVILWPLMLTAIAGAAGQAAIYIQLRRRLMTYVREVKI